MSHKVLPPFKRYAVTWLDACSEDSWTSLIDYKIQHQECTTTGWLVCEDSLYIAVASTLNFVEENGGSWDAGHIFSIPRGMILSMKEEKNAPKRQRKTKK